MSSWGRAGLGLGAAKGRQPPSRGPSSSHSSRATETQLVLSHTGNVPQIQVMFTLTAHSRVRQGIPSRTRLNLLKYLRDLPPLLKFPECGLGLGTQSLSIEREE